MPPRLTGLMILIYLMLAAYGQDDSSSPTCVLFPHSHLLCGQYIDASTMVYIDPNVFNYTEANNRIIKLDNSFGFGLDILISCRSIAIYTVCLSIYPHCNISTQKLVPPCMDDCLEYTNRCGGNLIGLTVAAKSDNDSLEMLFVLNCSDPFRAFDSFNVDAENCYTFAFLPMFVQSTTSVTESSNGTRLIMLPDQNSSTDYCSELQSKDISVACRAVGIPEPQVDILVNGIIVEPFSQRGNEVVIRLAPISYGEVVMFECQASTMTATANIKVNLSYTCCMDDKGTQYSFGQQFVTTDCCQCFCSNGGSISCDQTQNTSSISTGIVAVIIVITILVIGVIVIFMISVWWLKKKRYRKINTRGFSNPGNQIADHEIKTNNQTADSEVKTANEKGCMDDRGTQYSFGQQFVTTDCCQCFCGNGGSISCDQTQNTSSISTGIIAVIIVITILVIGVIVVFLVFVWWLKKKTYRKKNTRGFSKPGNQIADHEIKTDNQTADCEVKTANEKGSYLILLTSLRDDNFKLTQEIINGAFSKHQLQSFVISNDCLKICELLGTGSFGQVFYGLFTTENDQSVMEVAIKTIKKCHSMNDLDLFITESVIMKNFKHRNVLGLVGVSVGVENEIAKPYIVLPFMVNKDLKKFLRFKQSDMGNNLEASLTVINYSTLVKMCCDICCGMEYLASVKYVHRDLAARNCMVDKDLTVKIADFGLTRDIYCDDYYKMGHNAKVPIKWMPPESIHDRYYDEKTDVWSFGIVCWEVFSFGKQPYPGVAHQHILEHIESGNRLPKTALCKDEMYQIMLKCWQLKNSDRPTFSTLLEQLEQHYSDTPESDMTDPYLQLIN